MPIGLRTVKRSPDGWFVRDMGSSPTLTWSVIADTFHGWIDVVGNTIARATGLSDRKRGFFNALLAVGMAYGLEEESNMQQPSHWEIRRNETGWHLFHEGESFFVTGAFGEYHMDLLDEAGRLIAGLPPTSGHSSSIHGTFHSVPREDPAPLRK